MNFKFNKLKENGYQAYNLKQPAIYISAASKYALPEYKEIIAVQLNLPLSSIRIVEVSKTNDRQMNKIVSVYSSTCNLTKTIRVKFHHYMKGHWTFYQAN